MEKAKCKCCRKAKLFIVACVALAVIAAIVVLSMRKGGGENAGREPEAVQPRSAVEIAEDMIKERMSDPVYVEGLNKLSERYNELSKLLSEALSEYQALLKKRENGAAEEGDDALGAQLRDKIAKLEEAIQANRRIVQDYVAARVRAQSGKAAEAERENAVETLKARIERGEVKVEPDAGIKRPPKNDPPPREEGWWTNETAVTIPTFNPT